MHVRVVAQQVRGKALQALQGRLSRRVGIGHDANVRRRLAPAREHAAEIGLVERQREAGREPLFLEPREGREGEPGHDHRKRDGDRVEVDPAPGILARRAAAPAQGLESGHSRKRDAGQRRGGPEDERDDRVRRGRVEKGALPAGAVLEGEPAHEEPRDGAQCQHRRRQVQHPAGAGGDERRAALQPVEAEARERAGERARGAGIEPASGPGNRALQPPGLGAPPLDEGQRSANGEPEVDGEVPGDEPDEREGEDVHVPPVGDVLRRGADHEGGDRQCHADPGAPPERAQRSKRLGRAFRELRGEEGRPARQELLPGRLPALVGGLPARELGGGAPGVAAILGR